MLYTCVYKKRALNMRALSWLQELLGMVRPFYFVPSSIIYLLLLVSL